jgi:hypothetical protein
MDKNVTVRRRWWSRARAGEPGLHQEPQPADVGEALQDQAVESEATAGGGDYEEESEDQ